jgi:transcriptional regulator with XRE-family HTH domain
MMAKKKTTDAVAILRRRHFEEDPEMLSLLEDARTNAQIARKIHELRTASGLTQQALAERVGTTSSVICRLEDDDYEGHSLAMLRRVALALGTRIELRFAPDRKTRRPVGRARTRATARKNQRRGRAASRAVRPR